MLMNLKAINRSLEKSLNIFADTLTQTNPNSNFIFVKKSPCLSQDGTIADLSVSSK